MTTTTTEAPKAGEVWKIAHARKGTFTARILNDPSGEFFDVVIVEGKAKMASGWGDAGPGEGVTVKRNLVKFIEKVDA